MNKLVLMLLIVFVSGCQYLTPKGAEGDVIRINQECEVDVVGASEVEAGEDNITRQVVKVNPDCSVEVQFNDAIGEHVKELGQ